MEQIAILSVLRRYVVMVIALSLIAMVAGYGVTFILPNKYTAPALILVRPQQTIRIGNSKSSKEFLDFPLGSGAPVETASKTYIQIMESPALLGDVVRQLGLDKKIAAEEAKTATFWVWVRRLLALFKYGKPLQADPFTQAVDSVSAGLKLKDTPETYVFELKYSSSDAVTAAAVANATAKMLVKFINNLRASEAQHRLVYVKKQLQLSQQRLRDARNRLLKFQEAHNTFEPKKEYESKLKVIGDLEVELARAEQKLVGSQDTLQKVSLVAQRAKLVRLIADHKAELAPLPALERRIKQLDQNISDAANAYEIFDKDYEQTLAAESFTLPETRIVSPAVPPAYPSSPKRALIAIASLLGGMVAAIAIALVREYLNRQIRNIEQVEDIIGAKVLATVPRISRRAWLRA